MPKVSIIIPVYNVEQYLRRCLDSVLAQTYSDWEAVCVNDGSPDASDLILSEYATKDPRFVIVNKQNGGLSDARNVGVKRSKGDFLIFLDSDDFIHPQTLEIATGLQERENADIVSWYKDRIYRPAMIVRHKLGFSTIDYRPRGLRRIYSLDTIDCHTTNDIFAHVIEGSGSGIKYPLKHFYVVRFLLRRSFVVNVKFLKGIFFEDFPWWSEVILQNPRTTITQLPFYYYYPNFDSIDLSSTRAKKIKGWLSGIEHTTSVYEERATEYQKDMWCKNCLWPVLITHIAKKLNKVQSDSDKSEIRERLRSLVQKGVFDTPPGEKEQYYLTKIKDYIGEE